MRGRCALLVSLAALPAFAHAQTAEQRAMLDELTAGVWGYVDKSGKVLPSGSFTGTPPDSALLPAALAKRQAFDFRKDDPALGCGEPGMPRALTAGSPMEFRWLAADGDLEIRYESMDVRRRVALTSPRNVGVQRTPNGTSSGAWRGDVLVISTASLDDRVVDLLGTPKSDAMTLEERYRIEPVGTDTYLRIDLTMTDPKTFREPYAWHFDFVLRPDWEIMDYACEERPVALTPGVVPD
jgi:hypothetical protein